MKKCKTIALWIVLAVLLVLLVAVIIIGFNMAEKTKTDWQIGKGTYVENNVVGVDIPDGTLYIDKRLKYYERFCMQLDLNWLYKCKLYKDFGWYGDTYMVYTSLDYIRRNDDRNGNIKTNAYYLTNSKNDDKYIFFWNQTDDSLIHELAHFADDTHAGISQNDEWKNVYFTEWTENEWLQNYHNGNLTDEEQLSIFLKESFAEGFAQWYCDYYTKKFSESCSEEELEDLCLHVVRTSPQGISKEEYPLTYAYMADFYENYKFSDGFMNALEVDYTSVD